MSSVLVEPVDWIRYILGEVRDTLVYDDVDGVLHFDLTLLPLAVLILHYEWNLLIAQVFSERYFDDVAGQYVAELSCHVHIKAFGRASFDASHPLVECLNELDFECLQHVDKTIFVESVCTGLSLLLPKLVIVRVNERLANDMAEPKTTIVMLVNQRVL